jgi:acyl carrier protein
MFTKVANNSSVTADAETLRRVKVCLIECLELEEALDELDHDTPLFGNGERSLDLDSLAALEIIVALSTEFDIALADVEPEAFQTIRTLAAFVRTQCEPAPPVSS